MIIQLKREDKGGIESLDCIGQMLAIPFNLKHSS